MKVRMYENYGDKYAECRVFTSALDVDFEHDGDYNEDVIIHAIYSALDSCGLSYEDYVDFVGFGDATSIASIDFHWNEVDRYSSREIDDALAVSFEALRPDGIFYDGIGIDDVSEYYDEQGGYIG